MIPRRGRGALILAGLLLVAGCTRSPAQQQPGPPPASSTAPTASRSATPTAPRTPTRTTTVLDGDEPGGGPSGTPVAPSTDPERATGTPRRTPLPSGAAGTPRGRHDSPAAVVHDRRDAGQVAAAFAARLDLWDTAIDHRPNDAAKRAARLATAGFRHKMLDGAPVAAPGAHWTTLAQHHGWTTVTAQLGGLGEPPSDSPTGAWRVVTTTATPRGPHRWRGTPMTTTYAIQLVRTRPGNPWYVTDYRLL